MIRALLSAVLFMPAVGWAACQLASSVGIISPPDGATGVPLNVELRFAGCGWNDEWSFVEMERFTSPPATESRRGRVMVVRPDAPLNPNTRYRFSVVTEFGPIRASHFTTGSARDDQPPVLSGLPVATAVARDDKCDIPVPESATLTWPSVTDDATPASAIVLEGAVGESAEALSGSVSGVAPMLTVGGLGCPSKYELEDKLRVFLRARAVDWAGNFSELSEPFELPKPKNGCGCSSTPGALALLALLLLKGSGKRARGRFP